MTRGFEGNHVIPVRTHQHLKMKKKIVYSQLKSREKSHAMGRKKRTKTRQSKKSYETSLFVLITLVFACLVLVHIMMSQLMASLQMERESSEKERKKDQSVLLKRVR